MTQKQKILGVVLIILALGFLGDRFFLLPRSGQAVEETASAETTVDLKHEISDLDAKGASTSRLSTKLEELCPTDVNDVNEAGLRNPFMLSDAWTEKESEAKGPPEPEARVTDFQSRHRLVAVLLNGGKETAMVDDFQELAVGQELDGFVLVEILNEDTAVFESGSLRAILRLKGR